MKLNVDNKKMWDLVVERAKDSDLSDVFKDNFDLFIKDTKLNKIDIDNAQAFVLCENIFGKQFIKNNFSNLLNEILSDITNIKIQIVFYTKNEEKNLLSSNLSLEKELKNNLGVDPKYTFDDYIVSDKNRLLVQASKTISYDPAKGPYNPFFIHGGSGLGKTHLLHAIGNELFKKLPKYKIRYINAETYGNEVVMKMLNKKWDDLDEFKREFLNYDILLFDDIQYIATKDKTKETFFSILNTFIEEGKQIIITSDSSPDELSDFEERFKTRFVSGLTLPISAPDFKTSKEILKNKLIKLHNISKREIDETIDEESLEYLAMNYSSSVRELEGVLNNLMFWSINNELKKITLKNIFEILGTKKNNLSISIEKIKKTVSKKWNVSIKDLEGNIRKKEILIPRQVSIYLTKELMNLSLKKIGESFNNRDHTTIMNAINKIESIRKKDIKLNGLITDLKKELKIR